MEDNFVIVSKLLQDIPEFSGERNKNVTRELNQFTKSIEQLNKTLNYGQKTILVSLIIPLKLKGEAFSFLTAQRYRYNSIYKLLRDLKRHFIPIKSPTDVVSEINTTRQLPTEEISEFGARLQDLVATAKNLYQTKYPTRDTTFLEENIDSQAIKTFKNGLANAQFRKSLIKYEKSLNDLIDLAIRLEIYREVQKIRYQISNIENNEPHINFCSYCNDYGHSESQCQNNYCQNCNDYGHSRFDCQNNYCPNCNDLGHSESQCNNNFCPICNDYGHSELQCLEFSEYEITEELTLPEVINSNESIIYAAQAIHLNETELIIEQSQELHAFELNTTVPIFKDIKDQPAPELESETNQLSVEEIPYVTIDKNLKESLFANLIVEVVPPKIPKINTNAKPNKKYKNTSTVKNLKFFNATINYSQKFKSSMNSKNLHDKFQKGKTYKSKLNFNRYSSTRYNKNDTIVRKVIYRNNDQNEDQSNRNFRINRANNWKKRRKA